MLTHLFLLASAEPRLEQQIGVYMTPKEGEFVIVVLLAVVVFALYRLSARASRRGKS